MAINYDLINKGGISLSANFELLSEKPLDARQVVPTLEGLQNLIDNAATYEGMIVYVKDQKTYYKITCFEYDGTKYYLRKKLVLGEDELKDLIVSETAENFSVVDAAIIAEAAERQTAIETESTTREVADQALSASINQEKLRAEAEESRLTSLLNQTNENLNLVSTSLDAEISARTTANETLRSGLNAEITRATKKETELEQALNTSTLNLTNTINNTCATETLARIEAINKLTSDVASNNEFLLDTLNKEIEACREADTTIYQQLENEQVTRDEAIVAVRAELSAEATTAREAEEALNKRLSQEETATVAISSSLTEEITARGLADNALNETLTNKALELTAAIEAEKVEREANIESVTNAYTARIAQEKADREAAEQTLTLKITQESERALAEETRLNNLISQTANAIQTDQDLLNANIEAEIQARISGDSNLRTSITNEISRATQQENALETSINTAVTNLTATINSRCDAETTARNLLVEQTATEFTTKVNNLDTQLASEGLARETADTDLSNRLQTEVTTRENAISNLQADLSNEIEAARAAEETLNKKIEKEISDRSLGNLTITNQLSAETSNREAAIAALNTRVVDLEAIDHEQLAKDAAASAVATIRDNAPEAFDTLKEIAAWIAEENTAEDAASLVTRVSTIEGKPAMDITEDQIENWDSEVGVKVVVDTNKSTWDLAGTAVQSSDFESFKTTNSEAIATAQKAGEDAAAAVDTELTNYKETHKDDYTNKQIDDTIDAEVRRTEGAYSKIGHKHVVADITDYETDITDKLDSFNTTNISPILAKLVGIGGENQPATVIEAITDLIAQSGGGGGTVDAQVVTKTILAEILTNYATIDYVDSVKPGTTPSFSIEDDILIIG